MDHKLRPVVRVDADMRTAVVELHGCLTVPATRALVRILAKGRSLNQHLNLILDLRPARHIDLGSLAALRLPVKTAEIIAETSDTRVVNTDVDEVGPVKILLPPAWPACPIEKVLADQLSRERGSR